VNICGSKEGRRGCIKLKGRKSKETDMGKDKNRDKII
jgi:hypothetical protein